MVQFSTLQTTNSKQERPSAHLQEGPTHTQEGLCFCQMPRCTRLPCLAVGKRDVGELGHQATWYKGEGFSSLCVYIWLAIQLSRVNVCCLPWSPASSALHGRRWGGSSSVSVAGGRRMRLRCGSVSVEMLWNLGASSVRPWR